MQLSPDRVRPPPRHATPRHAAFTGAARRPAISRRKDAATDARRGEKWLAATSHILLQLLSRMKIFDSKIVCCGKMRFSTVFLSAEILQLCSDAHM